MKPDRIGSGRKREYRIGRGRSIKVKIRARPEILQAYVKTQAHPNPSNRAGPDLTRKRGHMAKWDISILYKFIDYIS